MPVSKLERLVGAYHKQLGVFQQMLALAEEQAKCVETANMPVLGEILERRDRLSCEIDSLNEEVKDLGQRLADMLDLPEVNLTALRGKLQESQTQPVAQVLSEIASVIMRIQAVDERTTLVLKEIMDGIKGEMSEVKRGQVAMKAYKQNPIVQQARFIDKQK